MRIRYRIQKLGEEGEIADPFNYKPFNHIFVSQFMHLDCNVTDVTEMIIWRYGFGKKQRNIFSSPEYSNALG